LGRARHYQEEHFPRPRGLKRWRMDETYIRVKAE
jgi:transposase-like protein